MKTRRIKHVLVTYFTCTRTEKHAAIVLGVVLLLTQGYLFVRYHMVQPKVGSIAETEYEAISVLQRKTKAGHTGQVPARRMDFKSPQIHPFDPNSLDENGFVQLGMSPRQAASLIRYRHRIGGFRSKEDVKRVRVLDPVLYTHWAPYIELPERNSSSEEYGSRPRNPTNQAPAESKPTASTKRLVIDLNDADTILMKELPWIGSGRARAISNYRERLGGFTSMTQLLEIRAIPDSVYQQILPFLTLNSGPYRKLEINRLPPDSLHHPYLGKQFARMIVSYRDQHGPYRSVNDLLALPLADEEILRKLAPYLIF